MTEYKKFLEEAAKRDHRKIGKVWFCRYTKYLANPRLRLIQLFTRFGRYL